MIDEAQSGWAVIVGTPGAPRRTRSLSGFVRSLLRRGRVDPDPRGTRLLTRRFPVDARGCAPFHRVFYCTRCKDYFGLVLHPPIESLPEGWSFLDADRIPESLDPGAPRVFCPACGTPYPQYGPVDVAGRLPPGMEPLEISSVVYPRSAPPTDSHRARFQGQVFPLGVVVLSGEFPGREDRRKLVCDLIERASPGLQTDEGESGVRLVVVRVNELSRNAEVLDPLLREVGIVGRDRVLLMMCSPVVELAPPLRQGMLCLARAYSRRP